MKIFLRILTVCLVFSFIASCAGTATQTTAPATEPPVVEPTTVLEPTLTPNEQWAKDNGLGPYQPATDDWAAIEAAAIKEGKGPAYANSGGVEDLPDAWYALYPDIEFDAADTDGIDTKMAAEQESGNVTGVGG